MEKFNAPPGWPKPPQGWAPKPGWKPEPSWAKAPEGWHFWINEWDEPVAGPPGLYGSEDVDATTAFNPEPVEPPTQTISVQEKPGVIAGAMQASRERGAERAAAEARSTIPSEDDASARKAVKWVAGAIVASVIFLALMAAFFHRSITPTPAKTTSSQAPSTPSSTPTTRSAPPAVAPSTSLPTAVTPTSALPTSTMPTSVPTSTYSTLPTSVPTSTAPSVETSEPTTMPTSITHTTQPQTAVPTSTAITPSTSAP